MKKFELLAASALAMTAAMPAAAQTGATTSAQNTAPTNGPGQEATSAQSIDPNAASADTGIQDIVVTAQRQSQRLQDVPIAVSAFSADNIEKQQIVNPIALQQSLPSITFTKTGYTTSSFTIRGIGDLCVGVTCDQATAIHVNDMPLATTRLFESEFFDLERVEVLRGPQGTLFGKNTTAGAINISSRLPLFQWHADGQVDVGNYDYRQVRGSLTGPLIDGLAAFRLSAAYTLSLIHI